MKDKLSANRPLTDEEESEVQRMIASDPDAPEMTDEQLATARPFREVFPDLAASIDREKAKRGRPPVENPREQISVRLDPDIIEHYKAMGKGWQTRLNEDLRHVMERRNRVPARSSGSGRFLSIGAPASASAAKRSNKR